MADAPEYAEGSGAEMGARDDGRAGAGDGGGIGGADRKDGLDAVLTDSNEEVG